MSWIEIDTGAKQWVIPRERSKNGLAHTVPLSDTALAILNSLPRVVSAKELIFTSTGATAPSGFSRAKRRLDTEMVRLEAERAGQEGRAPVPIPHWTFHDLRRTAASGMAGLGQPVHVVEALLNHRSGTIRGVAAVYNRYDYWREKRAALDAWADRLAVIIGSDAGKAS